MNEFLANMYGTTENIGAGEFDSDTEKLAQANVLTEMLTDEGIDVDNLSGETIAKVAGALFGYESELFKAAAEATEEEEGEDEDDKEGEGTAEEKTAEADFLGRQMAHAYVAELADIEKDAGVGSAARTAWGAIKGAPGKVHGAATRAGRKIVGPARRGATSQKAYEKALALKGGTPLKAREAAKAARGRLEAGAGYGAAGLGTGLLGAGGYGISRAVGKEKKGSAVDMLAEQRANEILAENGIGGGDEEKLGSAVEQRAYEMLVEAGYIE